MIGASRLNLDKLEFYYDALIQSEISYEIRNFLVYLRRLKAELMKDYYTFADISDFFLKLNSNLIDDEYKIAANICYSKAIYEKIPPNDVLYHVEVIGKKDNEDLLFKEKNLILNKGWI